MAEDIWLNAELKIVVWKIMFGIVSVSRSWLLLKTRSKALAIFKMLSRVKAMFLVCVLSFNLSKSINTLKRLYFAYCKSMPSTKVEALITLVLFICSN